MNPFVPTWGDRPPRLAGRDGLIHQLLAGLHIGPGRPEYHNVLVGLRGVGKTVVLNEVIRYGRDEHRWVTLRWTATRSLDEAVASQAAALRTELRGALRRKFRGVDTSVTIKGGAPGVLSAEARLAGHGAATSGAAGTWSTLHDLGVIARQRQRTVLIVVDELQAAAIDDLRTLAVALQDLSKGDHLPLAMLAAGLPNSVQRLTQVSTQTGITFFARQEPITISNLSADETADAIAVPFQDAGRNISNGALDHICKLTDGYPFAVQLAGYHTWDQSHGKGATIAHARAAEPHVHRRLEASLYNSVWSQIRPSERPYVIAVAELASAGRPVAADAIAAKLGRTTKAISPYRDRLINEVQVLDSTRRGTVEFTIPGFEAWVLTTKAPPPVGGIARDVGSPGG